MIFFKENYLKFRYLNKFIASKKIKKEAYKQNLNRKEKFKKFLSKKNFSNYWFLNNFDIFHYFLPTNKNKKFKYLEIGSWEGLSALNILFFFKNVDAKFIDLWDAPNFNSLPLTNNFKKIEKNFNYNLKKFKNFKKIKKDSSIALRELLKNKNKFDYIYVDGAHTGEDVLSDAIESFKVLNKNGIVFFDDAMHKFNNKIKYQVFEGLKYFLKMFENEIEILYLRNILVIRKK